jgi:hypothetical protein
MLGAASVFRGRRVGPSELGPHNARFYYGIVLENGSNVRGVCQHVTNLLQLNSFTVSVQCVIFVQFYALK